MPPKACEVCGNPVEPDEGQCPYCGHAIIRITHHSPKRKRLLKEVSLKSGNPLVPEAMARLDAAIQQASNDGVKILKLIHGYGSHGVGGAIKVSALQRLRRFVDEGLIHAYYSGESYFQMGRKHNPLIKKVPELEGTWTQDKNNPGLTLVEL